MIGTRIKELRKKRKITQIELSEYLNISQSTLALYESQKRAVSIDTLIKISQFFNVTTDYLLGISDISDSKETVHGEHLTEDEIRLLETYRCLNSDGKQIMIGKALDLKLTTASTPLKKKDIG